MVYKHTIVAAFHIYAQCGEDVAKRGGWKRTLNSHGNYIVDHGKSWICDFEFLWEPCQKNGLIETDLLSTHNICLVEK